MVQLIFGSFCSTLHCPLLLAENDDVKRRMLSCIVVVGGGLMFPMAHSWLQHLVWTQMQPKFRMQIEAQDVITRPKVPPLNLLQLEVGVA